ncbi:hypothetical protein J6590_036404 [Homalodisca vitripennis]|nr:hypothetical protein J6590_036404 [Homalodisca vitripennis]
MAGLAVGSRCTVNSSKKTEEEEDGVIPEDVQLPRVISPGESPTFTTIWQLRCLSPESGLSLSTTDYIKSRKGRGKGR